MLWRATAQFFIHVGYYLLTAVQGQRFNVLALDWLKGKQDFLRLFAGRTVNAKDVLKGLFGVIICGVEELGGR